MIHRLFLILILLALPAFLFTGCSGYPEGMKEFRRLTDNEKDRLVEIALDSEDAKRSLERYDTYEVMFGWAEIIWQKPEGEYLPREIRIMPYEGPEEIPYDVSRAEGELYADVILYFGEPSRVRLDVIINPDTWETVHVEWMGLKTLPVD